MERKLLSNKRLRNKKYNCDMMYGIDENSSSPHLLRCTNKADERIKYQTVSEIQHPLLDVVYEAYVCDSCFEKMFAGEK